MKTTINIISCILFYFVALTGLLWLYYKILDLFKVNTELPEYRQQQPTTTAYPDKPIEDFNSWSQYINKQL